jgi:hypothetical protein
MCRYESSKQNIHEQADSSMTIRASYLHVQADTLARRRVKYGRPESTDWLAGEQDDQKLGYPYGYSGDKGSIQGVSMHAQPNDTKKRECEGDLDKSGAEKEHEFADEETLR